MPEDNTIETEITDQEVVDNPITEPEVATPQVDVDAIRDQIKAELEASQEKEKELSKLSAEERAQREIEDREAKLAQREAEMAYKESLAETKEELAKRDIPVEFASMVVGVDNQQTFDNIKTFETKFNAAVNAAVKSRMTGSVAGTEQAIGGKASEGTPIDAKSSEGLRAIFGGR